MRKLMLSATLLFTALYSHAQQSSPAAALPRKMTVGFNLNNFGRDFGLGLNVSSPTFFGGHAAIRATANYQWVSHLNTKGQEMWTGYTLFHLGAVGINKAIADGIFLYGEGGVSLTVMDATMSSEQAVIGGYGLFGFEFLMPGPVSYYIELGGSGSGAVADKLPSSPIVANGFLAATGFRVRL